VRTAQDLGFEVEGIFSHFACADEPGHPSVELQRIALEQLLDRVASEGFRPRLRHLANSAGILADPRSHLDMVRPGLVLYGCLPSPALAGSLDLRSVMELRARILQTKAAQEGAGVGYGWTYRPERETRLAVLAIGYAQGYPRALSNVASVLVRGRRAPVVGTISMDHITIDVSDVPEVAVGDEAILWGGSERTAPHVMELGEAAGTIGYELMVRVGASVPRIYRGSEA
jgi:alanine racemase